jgi:hypothetical protein
METEDKLSLEEVKNIPPRFLLRLIDHAKEFLKSNDTMLRMFEEYDVPIEMLDLMPIAFADLDVSAKTVKGVVYLNYKLLCDGDFGKDYGYLIHELIHVLQQTTGSGPTKGSDDGEYLDNEYEVESFQNQVEFMANEFGEDEAEEYVDNLLEHHEIDDKKEHKHKKEELMSLI